MRRSVSRAVLGSLLAVTVGVMTAGVAAAVSGGGFNPQDQNCTQDSEANNAPAGYVQPGCHFASVNLKDGNGNRYAEVGLNELPNGGPAGTPTPLSLGYPGNDNGIHAGCAAVNTNGTGGGPGKGCGTNPKGLGGEVNFDVYEFYCPIVAAAGRPCQDKKIGKTSFTLTKGTPDVAALVKHFAATGMVLSFGMDDNSDAGEHDGVSTSPGQHCTAQSCTGGSNPGNYAGSVNGASDGGGTTVEVQPQHAGATPSLTNPLPVAGAQVGFCADGHCVEATTRQRTVYQGCSPDNNKSSDVKCDKGKGNSSRNVADYSGKKWDPTTCSSGDKTGESPGPQGCGSKGMDYYRQQEAHNVNAEPGVTVYEDPDPEGSPAGIYPDPAVYVGTCGVILGGGQAPAAPASPFTNSAGQLVIPTGC